MNPMTTVPADQAAWQRALYGLLRGMAAVLAVFVLVVATLLLVNHVRLLRAAPTDPPGMAALLERLSEQPGDQALRDQIRLFDLLARRAYFTGHEFARTGALLLAVGAGLLLVSVQGMRLLRPDRPGLPGCPGEGECGWVAGGVARRLILGLGVLWVGAALASGWLTSRGYDPQEAQRLLREAPSAAAADPDWNCAAANEAGRPIAVADPVAWRCNWPAFRGPDGNGVASVGARAPVDWDGASGRNIRWKTRIPRPGFSSPVVWEDRVMVTGGDREAREIYGLDANTGALLWRCPAVGVQAVPEVTEDTGYAAPTPVTNGREVVAIFATGELVCADLKGKRLWQNNLSQPDNPYGFASSLRLHDDLVFVQYDNVQGGELLAFDVRDGRRRWRVPRDVGTSWATPLLAAVSGGSPMLVLHAPPRTIAYDPTTGRELWSTPSTTAEMAICPGWAEGVLIIHGGDGEIQAYDVAKQAARWMTDEVIPDVSSPLATGEFVFLASSYGPLICLDQDSGKLLWRNEYSEGFWGSPTLVGDRVYLVGMSGVTRIVAAAREFREIAAPALGERSVCSPAIVDGRLYLRGFENLFCIEEGDGR
jgi:outer membrane protein assembly factor BamB